MERLIRVCKSNDDTIVGLAEEKLTEIADRTMCSKENIRTKDVEADSRARFRSDSLKSMITMITENDEKKTED